MRTELTVIRVKLFGDEGQETDQGRIPRLEAELKDVRRRVRRVEPVAVVMRGIWAVLLATFGYFLNHFLSLKGH